MLKIKIIFITKVGNKNREGHFGSKSEAMKISFLLEMKNQFKRNFLV